MTGSGKNQVDMKTAIDLRMKIAQVPQSAGRGNGLERPVSGMRAALFLVKPGTTAADLKAEKAAQRQARAEQKAKYLAPVLVMPGNSLKHEAQVTLGLAAVFGPLVWLLDATLHWVGLL